MTERIGKQADFGFRQVPLEDKQAMVDGVFDNVARRYDLMNDLMSGGLHRAWKDALVTAVNPPRGNRAFHLLDLAGGTGDLAARFARRVGHTGMVVHTDINGAMLAAGRDKLVDHGVVLPTVQCNAEALPFAPRSFDCVSIGFGLRNVTHQARALAEMARVLKPGGVAMVLEFSRVSGPLAPFYDWYSFNVLPALGRLVANDAASYRYLAESIRVHPDQEALKALMERSGFDRVDYYNLVAGVVALHTGRVC